MTGDSYIAVVVSGVAVCSADAVAVVVVAVRVVVGFSKAEFFLEEGGICEFFLFCALISFSVTMLSTQPHGSSYFRPSKLKVETGRRRSSLLKPGLIHGNPVGCFT